VTEPRGEPPGEDVEGLLEAATLHHRAGRLPEARRLYADVLAAHPEHASGLFRSGLLELQEGRPEAALAAVAKASALAPDDARYAFGLGQVLENLQRWSDAAAAYRRVLVREPGSLDAHIALGVALQRAGDLEPAAAAYRAALAFAPGNACALGNLGTVLREMGDLDAAIRTLKAAAQIEPATASHAINLGIAFCERREFSAAESALRQALVLEPSNGEATFNLGNALRGQGRTREACSAYRRAVEIRPDHAEALNNLGNALKELGDFGAAIAAFEGALRARPHYLLALNNAGCLLRTLGRVDAAEDMLRKGLALAPGHAALRDNLGTVLKDAGALDEAIDCYRRSLDIEPDNPSTHGNLAYALSFQSAEPAPILAECVRWGARFAAPIERFDAARDRTTERRLKVGYVSGDFRDHCQTLFTLPLFRHHDREAVEIFCYSSVERPDVHTERLAQQAGTWREVRSLDDAALARLIADDGIDVLVDLNMHMANGRPLVFARKPAPVQIAWLAYPGTTGIAAMDFRLSDPRLDPPEFDAHYTERTLRLDDTFWCYDPLTEPVPINPLPAGFRGYLTLGCLNNPCKLTDRTLELWGTVLAALPDARLKLMAPAGRHRARLLGRLETHGIETGRVSFAEFRPRAEYLRSYHDIDFGLDTFPYNGHTTSLDALWMGVPTLTRVGATSVGRAGLSQLHHLGLLDLAAESDRDFVAAARALAGDLTHLAELRANLRGRMERSPLMDAPRFARSIERAYRIAWHSHCSSPAGR
jgi:predicted O-linked N-acetylglucosamine transferase (SPINDLY family)